MSYHMKITAAAMISSALLLSGCASTGMAPNSPSNNYQLPQGIYDGYWAMTSGMNGEAAVVSFKNGMSYNYRFQCYIDGSYKQVSVEQYQLIPMQTSIGLQYGNEPVFSYIKVDKLVPKQALMLNQTFSKPELQRAFPNGQNFSYVYKTNLEPNCSL
ncbi:hypothetical protein [Psychrobacter sanguinis]|uniref:hypothetical protein n=1 Tax=Psychrobacter sanguinis TaxID=861445 RepID=UPI00191A78AF|nr:hypothetical protein [Psychrobacter sanguinis]MCC3309300.1 hypothetical protein [Psychrobacter sanguinis]UEC26572.1 hypothetical protein LK453_05570 [Psychrobacter sanguinis]